ncbi:MAG TPA: polyketide synthase, partial [Streptomyces sp.]|nr:polyketide synthase [Streptomyces sp.]
MSREGSREELIRRAVTDRLCAWYGLDPGEITDDRPFAELGLTSRDAVRLAGELGELTGEALPATLLWDAPDLRRLTAAPAQPENGTSPDPGAAPESGAPRTTGALPQPGALPGSGPGIRAAPPVAVIGIGCRLPGGVYGPTAFWQLLSEGRDAVSTVPDGRWDPFLPAGGTAPAEVSPYGAFLDDVTAFDAEFFGISAHEADLMDPQQRLLLEVAREGLDHAALPAPELAGSRTGVFIGISGNEYARLTTADLDAVDAWTPPGAALSIAANRLSYALDLRGPSLAVDTACSSSLVAVHNAVGSLANGESDTALAGGVNLLLSPALTLSFQRAGALAADGRCKTFDAAADGMVRGEGCAVVVLKRLAD